MVWETCSTLSVYVLGILGTWLAYNGHPILATIALAFCQQQAGWISHDFIHARGTVSFWNATVLQWANAFSRGWWSNKHNTHHVFTNYIGIDVDIENDPVFHLFFPDPKDDTFFRKMQHWYFIPVASILYFSWRIQSLQHSFERMDKLELFFESLSYIWLYFLGWEIAISSIYLGGFLVSFVVTATHQSEEMINPYAPETTYSFVETQFLSTRDARTNDFFTEWLWGGMQYQLEHHLFPTMPRYYYRQVMPLVMDFAAKNGLDYRFDQQADILYRNFETLKFYAGERPAEDKKKA